jgi:hypothetical protein
LNARLNPGVNTGFVKLVLPHLIVFVDYLGSTSVQRGLANSAVIFVIVVHFYRDINILFFMPSFGIRKKRSIFFFVKIDSDEKTHPTII